MKKDALVLYKQVPARILEILSDKIVISLPDGKEKKVRPKDIIQLHKGPIKSVSNIQLPESQTEEAWELLQGESPSLEELAELVFSEFTPESAWGAFLLLNRTPWFKGTVDDIIVRTPEDVERIQKEEAEKKEAEERWSSFITVLKKGEIQEENRGFLTDLEQYCLQKSKKSRILQDLGKQQSPENAHRLLLQLGVWDLRRNPWPERYDMPLEAPSFDLEKGPEVERRDLTHLEAFAIDDEGNKDPDDALSFADGKFWVHIADSSYLIPAGGEADREARGRAANLYIPETTVPMLPHEATEKLGLGLQEISPALSFAYTLDDDFNITDCEICFSTVKVTRTTYSAAETRLGEEPFKSMKQVTDRFNIWRRENGAIFLQLPEVKIRVAEDGEIRISPIEEYASRDLVAEAMMMTGFHCARFARDEGVPIPYVVQPAPEGDLPETSKDDPASMVQLRRFMKRSQTTTIGGPHSGMGLPVYTRATSPLRRYSDLLVQQQIRLYLAGQPLLSEEDILEGTASCESVTGRVSLSERSSNLHWKLVYLSENPDWEGEGIIVGRSDKQMVLQIPSLALETRIALKEKLALNSRVTVAAERVDVPAQQVQFKVRD
ncbi:MULTISPECIES: RNB domain-containing ribonuclease [unclassified Oceanispirochaeta]|uniref:RNB domain-containing ribonuclease n=1 Tax=unclassified Oceanispirochaeta TaxID=2635722 RepID=UPI000E09BE91|nr:MULTISPECIES: RNB domain-containing ribonuclease [unclassified Oceanispirochaeta]MBF9017038.1 RNB domain-containing ribonuclease [Oceanispirochaeta sp. M2]NPD73487.1 RNB domain-containing ribonuclease [Oceanispirochaeta sp. M1]RDG30778.1 RNB domain-containing ribonuclease [Oceanispirochaeta sp. M1]